MALTACTMAQNGRPAHHTHSRRFRRAAATPSLPGAPARRGQRTATLLPIPRQPRPARTVTLSRAGIRAGTSLTGLFGVGPVITAAVIGDVRAVSRFPSRNHFAAYNGTAPIEVSSGARKIYRLSRRGNRRLNHAIHMAAVTQIRYRHSQSHACFEKKLAEGKTRKEALRALKRQISDAIFTRLQADARRAATAAAKDPGGQRGNDSYSSAAGSHPQRQLFGQATPGPGHHPTTAASIHGKAGHCPAAATLPPAMPQVLVRARSEARTNDLEVRRSGGHTRWRGRHEGQAPGSGH